jgi:restriction system protein
MSRRRRRTQQTEAEGQGCLLLFGGFAALLLGGWWLVGGYAVLLVVAYLGAQAWQRRREGEWFADLGRLEDFLELDPIAFEKLTAMVLERSGYKSVRMTKASADDGVDLFCTTPDGRSAVVQCKRYSTRKVGSPAVRELAGTVRLHRVKIGVFVTTSTFSADAERTAKECGIRLIDGPTLARMHRRITRGLASGEDLMPLPTWAEGVEWSEDELREIKGRTPHASPTVEPDVRHAPLSQSTARSSSALDWRELGGRLLRVTERAASGTEIVNTTLEPDSEGRVIEMLIEVRNLGDRPRAMLVNVVTVSKEGRPTGSVELYTLKTEIGDTGLATGRITMPPDKSLVQISTAFL